RCRFCSAWASAIAAPTRAGSPQPMRGHPTSASTSCRVWPICTISPQRANCSGRGCTAGRGYSPGRRASACLQLSELAEQVMRRITDEKSIVSWDATVDVLVVGLGCAGATAAIEAARSGADTMILERASGGGGTTAMSGAVIYCGGGTALQQACGFDDTVEDMYRYLC